MTKQTRRILFFAAVLFFVVATPIVVQYSRGLRLDFKTWKFVETGGFFFKITGPVEVQIDIDGKPAKTTSSFSFLNNAFLQNLTPGFYNVKISKDGYQDWQKTLKIESQLVTEAHNIVLVPENLKLRKYNIADHKIGAIYPSPSKKYMALAKTDGKSQTILGILDLVSTKEKEILLSKDAIDIEMLEWQEDYNKILFKQKSKNKIDYILVDTAAGETKYLGGILPKQIAVKDIDDIKIASAGDLFILKDNILYAFNPVKKTAIAAKKDILAAKVNNDTVYYFTAQDLLFFKAYFKNGVLSGDEAIGTLKLKVDMNPAIDIFSANQQDKIFILEKNSGLLAEFFSKEGGFSKIDENVKNFSVSGDQKKVLYLKDGQLWSYYRDDIKIQPFKYKDQKELVAKAPTGDIKAYQWFQTDNHIIYSFGNSVKFIELDNRDNINLSHVAELVSPAVFYDNLEERLYILSDGILYTTKILAQ